MPRLDGRKILITGGASGIGRATCELFAREGAAVAVLDRDAARVDRGPCDRRRRIGCRPAWRVRCSRQHRRSAGSTVW